MFIYTVLQNYLSILTTCWNDKLQYVSLQFYVLDQHNLHNCKWKKKTDTITPVRKQGKENLGSRELVVRTNLR